ERTTTMLAFESGGRSVVVDCGGDVVQRLMAAGVDPAGIEALIVTHEHPDHVAGFPLFMEKIWLLGRRHPIDVYGIRPALDQARRAWNAFHTGGWEGVPEIVEHEIRLEPAAPVLSNERWRITAAPGTHSVPVVGIRVEDAAGTGVCTYSCDTAKSDDITALARGADLLIHEGTGTVQGGHTTYVQAAEVARDAGARRLVLVHLPVGVRDEDLAEARSVFADVTLGEDGTRHDF
ncbi:MAG TPA: MBL fold metallo-hydrolase, partial [Longimicrobium sp.]|nr:MBL fold metallo-hydrolase [Longimicrobium sp.]